MYMSRRQLLSKQAYILHGRHCTPLFMMNKHGASQNKRNFGTALKYLQVNNGKKLINQKVKGWLKSKGIELQISAPCSLEKIGVVEQFNWTLIELVCTMLIGQNLPSFLWAEAVAHTAYI